MTRKHTKTRKPAKRATRKTLTKRPNAKAARTPKPEWRSFTVRTVGGSVGVEVCPATTPGWWVCRHGNVEFSYKCATPQRAANAMIDSVHRLATFTKHLKNGKR